MNEKTGIFTDEATCNFKEIIMAEKAKSSDQQINSSMSMELCLEINEKLQILLEDTLIKNLTLKVYITCFFIILVFRISNLVSIKNQRKACKYWHKKPHD